MPNDLRKAAKVRLKAQEMDLTKLSEKDIRRLAHELQVHQVELEIQNEELKRAQSIIEASRQKYSDLYDFAPVGYVTLDEEGIIMEANLTFCTQMAMERNRLTGKPLSVFIHPSDRAILFKHLKDVFQCGQKISTEMKFLLKEGVKGHILLESIAVEDDEEDQTCRTSVIDITGRVEMEQAIMQAKEVAEEANKLKDKFISLVSHDLKNPLSRMSGYIDLIEMTSHLSEKGREMVKEGRIACNDMTTFINEILSMNRIKGGIMHPQYAFIYADRVAGQAVGNYADLARQKGVEIKNSIPSEFRLYADDRLILEVFRNLLSNAIKFSEKEGTIHVYVPSGEKSVIAISDSGVGIDRKRIANLFKYDEQTSTPGTYNEGGSGLGLPLSRDIMAAHCGDLTLSSSPGEGTTFYMKFPYIRPTLMLVDCDETMRELFKSGIKQLDVSFVEAVNGEEALHVMKGSLTHLIFIDVQMPDMKGLELLKSIKNMPGAENIPVIVLSSDKSMEMIDSFFECGADDFLIKPFKYDEMITIIKRYIC